MDYKKVFGRFEDQNGFIKAIAKPAIDGNRKAALNRKGNMLFNSGDIEAAKRVFLTTGYSDGLSRVGDYYQSQGRELDALRMYWIAPNKTRAEPIIMRLSALIQKIMREKEDSSDERES
jgi:hypothetical protein